MNGATENLVGSVADDQNRRIGGVAEHQGRESPNLAVTDLLKIGAKGLQRRRAGQIQGKAADVEADSHRVTACEFFGEFDLDLGARDVAPLRHHRHTKPPEICFSNLTPLESGSLHGDAGRVRRGRRILLPIPGSIGTPLDCETWYQWGAIWLGRVMAFNGSSKAPQCDNIPPMTVRQVR